MRRGERAQHHAGGHHQAARHADNARRVHAQRWTSQQAGEIQAQHIDADDERSARGVLAHGGQMVAEQQAKHGDERLIAYLQLDS